MFRKKSFSDELFLHFSAKVQNLTVFSFIYMIRIRFFGPRELNQKGFRAAQYISFEYMLQDFGPCLGEKVGEGGRKIWMAVNDPVGLSIGPQCCGCGHDLSDSR